MAVRAPRACMTTDGVRRAVREWPSATLPAAELCSSGAEASANQRSSIVREGTGHRVQSAVGGPKKPNGRARRLDTRSRPRGRRGIRVPGDEHGLDRAPRQLLLLGRPDRRLPQPSRRRERDHGVPAQAYGCELVQESAILLRVNQAVACTGQTLLHRFYAKRSLKKFDVERVAATCAFLACKLEEQPRKVRDVINVFHRGSVRRRADAGKSEPRPADLEPLNPLGETYDALKRDLIRTERHALREFGFCVQVEHPHKFVLNYLRMFEHGDDRIINAPGRTPTTRCAPTCASIPGGRDRRRVRAPGDTHVTRTASSPSPRDE